MPVGTVTEAKRHDLNTLLNIVVNVQECVIYRQFDN